MNHKKHDASNRRMPTDPDITRLQATITNLLTIGDKMYNPVSGSVTKDVIARNNELLEKKAKIDNDIEEQQAIISRLDRDFTDVRNELPEKIPNKSLHFIEDYTLVILCISYFFMIIVALHIYVMHSTEKWTSSLPWGLFYSVLLTLISGMLLYYIA